MSRQSLQLINKISDWTRLTDDPLDNKVRTKILQYLNQIRTPLPNNHYERYLAQEVRGLSVLDIGVCEHTLDRIESANWKHNIVRGAASRAVGVDIIPSLVDQLNARGYDIRLCDATSDVDLGERFDIVVAGDVIEHVDSPVALMKFAQRHLKPGGKIVVRTPNPYNFNYVRLIRNQGTDLSNLEHMFYICPIHMMEIARRAGLSLNRYYTLYPGKFSVRGMARAANNILRGFKWRHALSEYFCTPEQYTTIYVYELSFADKE